MPILVRFLTLLLIPLTLLQVLCLAQQVRFRYNAVPREIIEQRLRRVSNDNAKREADLRAMFEESGWQPGGQTLRH